MKKTKTKFIGFVVLGLIASLGLRAEPQPNCMACSLKLSKESAIAGAADPCEDLSKAACLDSNGQPKYKPQTQKDQMRAKIKLARDKTAKEMGFKDFDDAVIQTLKKEGIDLVENLDPETFAQLKHETDIRIYNSAKVFSVVEKCDKELEELRNLKNSIGWNKFDDLSEDAIFNLSKDEFDKFKEREDKIKDLIQKFKNFNRKYKDLEINLWTKDLPNFYHSNIALKCPMLENKIFVELKENASMVEACKKIASIKLNFIKLYRSKESADYEQKAQYFIKQNYLPEIKYINFISNTQTNSPINKLKSQLDDASNSSSCSPISTATENAANAVIEKLFTKVNTSKTTVDTLIDSVYSEERKKQVMSMWQTTKKDVQDLVEGIVQNKTKANKIIDGYDSLKILWLEKPKDSDYLIQDGLKVLNPEKASEMMPTISFLDPSLSSFTSPEAYYSPKHEEDDEQIIIYPMIIESSENDPYQILLVMAHEAGHKIDPVFMPSIGETYKELLKCYQSPKSISLQPNQAREAISDYISSEVLARQISKLPEDKRKQAVMSAVGYFCNRMQSFTGIFTKDIHPIHELRISGIYGTNPSIRKVMGCQGDSPYYKTCGLKTSILDLPESGHPQSTNSKKEGVQ